MGHDFKPGDLAMIQAHVGTQETLAMYGHDNRWHGTDGIYRLATNIRPLVVIDPEDRDQAIRLTELWYQNDIERGDPHRYGQMQAALREFAAPTPPRPDEPTGLGAVAVAGDGRTWIHHGRGDWMRDDGLILQWNDLTILRVVAEGVQPC